MSKKQIQKVSLDFFSQEFLDEMKTELQSMLIETEEELQKFAHTKDGENYEPNFPDYGTDEDDDVQEVEAFIVNKPMEVVFEKKLRDIKKALKRIEDNTYGICKFTEEKIDERRLRARPTSNSSVAAKKLLTDEA